MTSLAAALPPPPDAAVVTQLGDCVQELALLAGAGCFVEAHDGRLLAHQLLVHDVDPALVAVLVRGTLSPLHAALRLRRTVGVLPSGPVIEGDHEGRSVMCAALPGGGVWLLVTREVPLAALQEPIARLAALLACATPATEGTCLEGGPLPNGLHGCVHLWVARVTAEASSGALLLALAGTPAAPVSPVRIGEAVYLVVGATRTAAAGKALRTLRGIHSLATRRLGMPVTAGISAACEPSDLLSARSQADAAASAAPAGECADLETVRAQLIVRHLAAGLANTPDVGPDPLQRLLDYDRRRNAQLAQTLLGWLNTGDIPRAATELGLHHNSLRYRLRRATEILGVDLRLDPAAKVVIHLQLLSQQATEVGVGADLTA